MTSRKYSDEEKENMRIRNLGENNPMYGRVHSKESKIKISNSMKGNKNRGNVSGENNPMWGRNHTLESIKKMRQSHIGKQHSDISKLNMKRNHAHLSGSNHPMYGRRGEFSPSWKGGKSFIDYPEEFNCELKNTIRKRQNNKCADYDDTCNTANDRRLHIHHIDQNKKNNDESNLIALCRSHHMRAHNNIAMNRHMKYNEELCQR